MEKIIIDEIDKLLDEKKNKTTKKATTRDLLPKKISFTQGAYQKASMIGPIVERLTGTPLEWSAFLLAEQGDKDFLVRDILIHEGQDISGGTVEMTGEEIGKTIPEVTEMNKRDKTNRYVIGWIHGHGRFALIPSSTDRKNFVKVLNSVRFNTEQKSKLPLRLIETELTKELSGGKLIYSGKAIEDATIEIALPTPESLETLVTKAGLKITGIEAKEKARKLAQVILENADMQFFQSNIFGFAYYVIMNNIHDKPYAGIGYSTEKSITKTTSSFDMVEGLNVAQVRVEGDIVFNEAELEKEIKEKIDYEWNPLKTAKGWLSKIYQSTFEEKGSTTAPSERPTFFKGYGVGYGNYGGSYGSSMYIPNYALQELNTIASELEVKGSAEEAEKLRNLLELMKKIDTSYGKQGVRFATEDFLRKLKQEEPVKVKEELDEILKKNDTRSNSQ